MGGQVGAELGGQSEWEFGGQVGGIIYLISAPYNIYANEPRCLKESTMGEYGKLANEHLTAKADENKFQDNPSPYIFIPKPSPNQNQYYQSDFGQTLYGFESFIWQIGNGFNPLNGYDGFNNYDLYKLNTNNSILPFPYILPYPVNSFPITLIPFDYSGIIANVATPAAEYFYHLMKTKSYRSDIDYPIIADLDFYYSKSAPEADLFGNADARGLYNAYLKLINNVPLRLSDIFNFYYNGISNNLDTSGLTQEPFFSSSDKWKILTMYLGFLKKVGSNYTWLPDVPTDPDWINIKNKFLNKMWIFTEFWYNTMVNTTRTGFRVARDIPSIIRRFIHSIALDSNFDKPFELDDYNPTDINIIKNALTYCLDNKFIPFLKSKVQEESSGII